MKIFSENEWDGKPLKYCLILCLCIFLIPQFILADRTISGIKNSDPQLKKEEIELAEEYQDIISQIEKISNDYQEYFSKIDNKYAKKYKEVLIKILLKINHGKYCGQVDYLLDDLNRFTQELNVREQSLKNQQDQKKFYRLVRNLRSQINLLAEYLKEDISERFAADKESLKNIEEYLKKQRDANNAYDDYLKKIYQLQTELLVRLQLEGDEINYLVYDDKKQIFNIENVEEIIQVLENFDYSEYIETFKALDKLEEAEKLKALTKIITAPQPPKVKVVVPEVKVLPGLDEFPPPPKPNDPESRTVINIHDSGEIEYSKTFSSSVKVGSKAIPIYINNQIGDLKITGWGKNKVDVSFEIEVLTQDKLSALSMI